jgi:hypothetical protein
VLIHQLPISPPRIAAKESGRRLQALRRLVARPDVGATERLLAGFSPDCSLATAHLWH